MSVRPKRTPPTPTRSNLGSYFALLAGLFLTLALVKWGNPVILDSKIEAPKNFIELLYGSWPIHWAYWLVLPLVLAGAALALQARNSPSATDQRPKFLRWVCLLPLVWFGWQLLSTFQTIDNDLTAVTLKHFAACTLFFYLGYFGLRDRRDMRLIWVCLTLALFCILRAGFDQHFGGLEETRRFIYNDPHWRELPAEFLKKVASDRIFGTLCYPNTLAGAILLLLPISLGFFWTSTKRISKATRIAIVFLAAAAGAACLYWSRSKAGWLIALLIGIVALLHAPLPKRWKQWLVCGVLVLGLTGFGLRYAGFFQRGATSVAARFDYWHAAVVTTAGHPILGSGPGTFLDEYRRIKTPEAEMTRLVHNDYLEQASDSGIPGFLIYTSFFAGSLFLLYREITCRFDLMHFCVWLGLLGISLHSLVEFHLYIPALAWTVFFLLGWASCVSRLPNPAARPAAVTSRTKTFC